ncbi:hypothetical protein [Candidatus Viadribacter manganicus]|uniref:DUF1579 domain-containing protein n=1 Tax=Candidatus Viadribacter manganicus TaxID=1759059 RepID=A0A1B1AEK5_9PROT|nr:hypothetical protein [Candidatus Viadribacter manganicus]ANP44982.1 hypothetical protein ATE48_03110 [Candidatus Viadribacter manganicus]
MDSTHALHRIRNALAVIALISALPAVATATEPPPSARCSAAEYRQFDFWIGEWDTFEMDAPNGSSIARAEISPIVDGCALHERYQQSDGLVGDSLLSFDPVRRQWQQTWITNRGSNMVLWGELRDGALVLEGEAHLHDGAMILQRITWRTEGDAVRETAVLSTNGGESWEPTFDVLFRKREAQADDPAAR